MISPVADLSNVFGGVRSAEAGAARTPASFEQALNQASERNEPADLRAAAVELVSTALVKPVLASLREHPLLGENAGPFGANPVEQRFGPLLDQHFADRVTSASKFPLIDRIVDKFSKQGETSS